jgi:hypothetical protein
MTQIPFNRHLSRRNGMKAEGAKTAMGGTLRCGVRFATTKLASQARHEMGAQNYVVRSHELWSPKTRIDLTIENAEIAKMSVHHSMFGVRCLAGAKRSEDWWMLDVPPFSPFSL